MTDHSGDHPSVVSPADRARLATDMLTQARACALLGSAFYARLLPLLADDARAGGPVAQVLAGHLRAPQDDLMSLRLLGTVHGLVLAGDAPELAVHYPSVGGDGDAEAAWPRLRALLTTAPDRITAGLAVAPQTNEVARSAALLGGMLWLLADDPRPVRLIELGASGGLNLRADHFHYVGDDGVRWGDPDSPVRLDGCWQGARPPVRAPVRVVERRGCDLAPIDATQPDGQRRLASYVWPDQVERLERLCAAFAVAERVPVELERVGAARFLSQLQPVDGTLTLVWHSIMWQYLSQAERAASATAWARLAAAATERAPVARLSLEMEGGDGAALRAWRWPGGEERLLGVASPHGLPVRWR